MVVAGSSGGNDDDDVHMQLQLLDDHLSAESDGQAEESRRGMRGRAGASGEHGSDHSHRSDSEDRRPRSIIESPERARRYREDPDSDGLISAARGHMQERASFSDRAAAAAALAQSAATVSASLDGGLVGVRPRLEDGADTRASAGLGAGAYRRRESSDRRVIDGSSGGSSRAISPIDGMARKRQLLPQQGQGQGKTGST